MSDAPRKRSLPSSSGSDAVQPQVRHKRGKRIVQLLQQQQDDLELQQQQQQQQSQPASTSQPTVSRPADHPPTHVALVVNKGRSSLLQVPGLTRETLDTCIASFFATIEPAYRLSQSRDLFLRRVRVLLYDVAGADVPNDLLDVPAASQLLVLAVAHLGAPFSVHADIAQSLYRQCKVLTEEPGYLDDNILDTIEAINLLENVALSAPDSRALSSPVKLDPLGKGYAVDLALYHKLNLPPLLSDTDPEYQRRETLFWTMWESDAIRMATARVQCRLSDNDVGWAPPAVQGPHHVLAQVARQICSDVLSVRAKLEGISEAALFKAIAALDGIEGDMSAETSSPEELFHQSTRNLLYLVCWVAAKDNNLATTIVDAVEAATMNATKRMAVLAQTVTRHNLLKAAPRAVRDHLAAFLLFLVRRLAESGSSSSDAVQYFALAETLGRAIRSATVYPDSGRLANVLREALFNASRNLSPNRMVSSTPGSRTDVSPLTTTPSTTTALSASPPTVPPQGLLASAQQTSTDGDLFSSLLATVAPESAFPPVPMASPQFWVEPMAAAAASDTNIQLDDQSLTDFLIACGIHPV